MLQSGIRYAISGHSGEEMDISFVPFTHHIHTSKKRAHVSWSIYTYCEYMYVCMYVCMYVVVSGAGE